jgi:hypothetical protein
MPCQWVCAALLGASVVCASSLAHAQCTKDIDCAGELVCDAGQCTPQAAAPAPAAASAPAGPAPQAAQAPTAATSSVVGDKPELQRRSTAMMAGGIVMVAVGPVLWVIAALPRTSCNIQANGQVYGSGINDCNDHTRTYALLISGAVLVGAGIPLIVIGAKKVPVAQSASLSFAPWVSPTTAGVDLRLDL